MATSGFFCARPRLHARLDDGASRRLTTVVAGPGFGKSTLVADWVGDRPHAWITVHPTDSSLPAFASALIAALEPLVPGLAASLGPVTGAHEPEQEERGVVEAVAAHLSDALRTGLDRDVVVVIDDAQELPVHGAAVRLVEGLCRHAPEQLHLAWVSRIEPPFPIERLRGRGEVLEVTAQDLAFDEMEVGELLSAALGERGETWAAVIHEMTDGWPAATRLAVEAVRAARPAERTSVLIGLRQPGGALFSYLAGEVFDHEPAPVRQLIRAVAPFERFNLDLCRALGVADPEGPLADLRRRGLFVRPDADRAGWYSLHALVRDFVQERWPIQGDELAAVHDAAARWFDRQGLSVDALSSRIGAGDPAALADFLAQRGAELLAAGMVDPVLRAVSAVPKHQRTPDLWRLEADSRQARGDWEGALGCLVRAGAGAGGLTPALAWRRGRLHYMRGELAEALAVYEQAVIDGTEPCEEALLFALQSNAHWRLGALEVARGLAGRALEIATHQGDHGALAAAHNALGLLATTDGDSRATVHFLTALANAEQAGDTLQVIRIRTNLANHYTIEGEHQGALAQLDTAIRLADVAGVAIDRALALSNRGETRAQLGQLDEAVADLTTAARTWRETRSASEYFALVILGHIHRDRGDLAVSRAFYEDTIRLADRAGGDMQALVPALSGLARILATEDPERACALAERAVSLGPGPAQANALLADGWVALSNGDRERAAARAADAVATATARRDPASLAEAIELRVLSSPDPRAETSQLEEAVSIWQTIGNQVGEARTDLVRGRLGEGADARRQEERAERQLRALGVRTQTQAAGPLLVTRTPLPRLVVRTLGRFEVLRDGQTVPASAWQSKKARDLFKVLLARRGRPVGREALMDLLWPDEAPARLGNRLSAALSVVRGVLDPDHNLAPEHYVAADASALRVDLTHLDVDVEAFLADADAGRRLLEAGRSEEGIEIMSLAEASYAGDFLEEDAYEDWPMGLREEARAAYLRLVWTLAQDATQRGDPNSAIRWFLRLLERDPYDEDAHLRLVSAFEEAGRHGEARRRFRLYVDRMEEIAVEPAPFPSTVRI